MGSGQSRYADDPEKQLKEALVRKPKLGEAVTALVQDVEAVFSSTKSDEAKEIEVAELVKKFKAKQPGVIKETWQSGPWGKGLCIALGAAAGLLTAAVVLIGIPPLFMWELGILAGSALLGCGLGVTAWCFFPRDRIGYVAQLAVAFARENAKNKKIIHSMQEEIKDLKNDVAFLKKWAASVGQDPAP